MFNCSVCGETFGPNVKPVRVVTGTRQAEYHYEYLVEDEWGNKQKREGDSTGTEITRERLVCAEDAKKHYGIGVGTSRYAGSYPVGHSFREKQADPFTQPLFASAGYAALDRLEQDSKRGKRDAEAAVPMIKGFLDRNKGYKL